MNYPLRENTLFQRAFFIYTHIRKLGASTFSSYNKAIFIVDRGYESYNNLAHIMEKNAFFVFRGKDINSSGILSGSKQKLPDTEEFDTTLSLILTRKWTNEVLNHPEIYRRFRNKVSFEFLDLDEHAYYNMTLRVLRFPISETEYECVITNLPTEDF